MGYNGLSCRITALKNNLLKSCNESIKNHLSLALNTKATAMQTTILFLLFLHSPCNFSAPYLSNTHFFNYTFMLFTFTAFITSCQPTFFTAVTNTDATSEFGIKTSSIE